MSTTQASGTATTLTSKQWMQGMMQPDLFAKQPGFLGYAAGTAPMPNRTTLSFPDAPIELPPVPKLADLIPGQVFAKLPADQTSQVLTALTDPAGPYQVYGRRFAPDATAVAATEPETEQRMAIVVAKQADGSGLFYCGIPLTGLKGRIQIMKSLAGVSDADITALDFPHPGPGLLREGAILIMNPLYRDMDPDFGTKATELTNVSMNGVMGRFTDGSQLLGGGDPGWGMGQLAIELTGPDGMGVIWLLTSKPV